MDATIDLREKIVEEIKKSGFPLEIYSTAVLKKLNWFVNNGVNYFNTTIQSHKEIDIVAKKREKLLIIECKKSETKPWVFFKQSQIDLTLDEFLHIFPYSESFFEQALKNLEKWNENLKIPICEHYIIPFLSQNKENELKNKENDIHRATNQVIDALSFYSEKGLLNDLFEPTPIKVRHPLIVLDGRLMSAFIKGDRIKIKEEKAVILCVTREVYKSQKISKEIINSTYHKKRYLIPIVKKTELEKYLKLMYND